MLTQKHLHEIVSYDPDTGIFIRKVKSGKSKPGAVIGSKNGDGYIYINIIGLKLKAHHLAWLYVYGEWPNMEIDHINHTKDDNRIKNLRHVSRKENSKNQPLHSNNKSGHRGIHMKRGDKKWTASISVNNSTVYLGRFESKEEAIAARLMAEKSLW